MCWNRLPVVEGFLSSFEKLRSLGDDVNIRELYLTEMDGYTGGAMATRTSPNQ
jgi:hypothetical protein